MIVVFGQAIKQLKTKNSSAHKTVHAIEAKVERERYDTNTIVVLSFWVKGLMIKSCQKMVDFYKFHRPFLKENGLGRQAETIDRSRITNR